MVLTETEEALISLLRASLWGEKSKYELTGDVLREANDHTVAGLIADDSFLPHAASFFYLVISVRTETHTAVTEYWGKVKRI